MTDLLADPALARWPGLAPEPSPLHAPVLSTVQARRERDEATAASLRAYLEGAAATSAVDIRL